MSTTAFVKDAPATRRGEADALASVSHASVVLIVAGLGFVALAVAAPEALAWIYRLYASSGTVTTMDASARFGAALFGALTFGWGVTMQQLGRGRSATRAITVGALAWFVVDSAASVATGYAGNVLSNVAFVVLILVLLRRGGR